MDIRTYLLNKFAKNYLHLFHHSVSNNQLRAFPVETIENLPGRPRESNRETQNASTVSYCTFRFMDSIVGRFKIMLQRTKFLADIEG
jgi:hypothetical protein